LSTVQELFRRGIQLLGDLPQASLEAKILLLKSAALSEKDFHSYPHREIPLQLEKRFLQYVSRRKSGCPLSYITGEREFWSIPFVVFPGVLIPRPETELLVEKVVGLSSRKEELIVDVGTGAGNIAISLARELPLAKVIATDMSVKALEAARHNASLQNESSVIFVQGNLFSPLFELGAEGKCDFIVSNPPYVSEKEWEALPREVKEHEPREALVAGEDGLDVIRRLIDESPRFLKSKSYLCIEIGANHKEDVLLLFGNQWGEIACFEDLAGIPRVITAMKD